MYKRDGRPESNVRIQLLRGFRVEVGARLIPDSDWRLQKARGLVKLLALAPQASPCARGK